MSPDKSLAPPPGGAARVGKLDTLAGIRREQVKVYRVARRNEGSGIDSKSGARLTSMLDGIARSIIATDVEARLSARLDVIERALGVSR